MNTHLHTEGCFAHLPVRYSKTPYIPKIKGNNNLNNKIDRIKTAHSFPIFLCKKQNKKAEVNLCVSSLGGAFCFGPDRRKHWNHSHSKRIIFPDRNVLAVCLPHKQALRAGRRAHWRQTQGERGGVGPLKPRPGEATASDEQPEIHQLE